MAGFGVYRFRHAVQRVNDFGLAACGVVLITGASAKLVFRGRDLAGCVVGGFADVAGGLLGFGGAAQQVVGGFFTQPGLAVFDFLPLGVVVPSLYGAVRVRGLGFFSTGVVAVARDETQRAGFFCQVAGCVVAAGAGVPKGVGAVTS